MRIEILCTMIVLCVSCSNKQGDSSLSDNNGEPTQEIIEKDSNSLINSSPSFQDDVELVQNLQKFWLQFCSSIRNREDLSEMVSFPLEVECFVNGERGGVIKLTEQNVVFDRLLNSYFLDKAASVDILAQARESWNMATSVYGEDFQVSIERQDNATEGGIVFKFEKDGESWKLIEIFCLG